MEVLVLAFTKEELEVTVKDDILAIRGEKSESEGGKNDKYILEEFDFDTFERKFKLAKCDRAREDHRQIRKWRSPVDLYRCAKRTGKTYKKWRSNERNRFRVQGRDTLSPQASGILHISFNQDTAR